MLQDEIKTKEHGSGIDVRNNCLFRKYIGIFYDWIYSMKGQNDHVAK